MIVDSHTHNFKAEDKFYKAEDLISSMDKAGIDYSLLIANSSAEEGILTDEAVKISEQYPRLKPIGSMLYDEIKDGIIDKLVKLLEERKIFGVKLYPGYEDYYPNDEKLLLLYDACQKMGKPVIFHTGVLLIGSKGLLKQIHPLNIDEVANRFPDLKIVMAHFGNPWIVDAAAVMLQYKNVYADLSGYFEEFKSIKEKDVEDFIKDIGFIKNFVGDYKKFLFGTDFPLYSQKEYLDAVQKLPLSDEEKDLVFWKNAKDIFNLDI